MPRRPVSVTLEADNIAWLKGRAGAAGESVSEVLDQLVTQARHGGSFATPRTVVGTVDIHPVDPALEQADAAIQSLFDASVRQPLLGRERAAREVSPGIRKRRG
jgi:hypothetical protein